MDQKALEIRSRISSKRMAEDVKKLVALGPRHAGTGREHEAAVYIEDQFLKAGVSTRTDMVENIISWKLNDCRVKVIDPVQQELTAIALLGSASTPNLLAKYSR